MKTQKPEKYSKTLRFVVDLFSLVLALPGGVNGNLGQVAIFLPSQKYTSRSYLIENAGVARYDRKQGRAECLMPDGM
jgi:hypothetical protein